MHKVGLNERRGSKRFSNLDAKASGDHHGSPEHLSVGTRAHWRRFCPDDLAAHIIKAVVARSGIDPALIEDVYFGATNQAGEDNRNVARMAALLAGLPRVRAGFDGESPLCVGAGRPSTSRRA